MVNAGPAVFVSTAGPNPIMVQVFYLSEIYVIYQSPLMWTLKFIMFDDVQPLPFQPGANFGAIPVGTVQNDGGLSGPSIGSGFTPRNIDIRIRTGFFSFLFALMAPFRMDVNLFRVARSTSCSCVSSTCYSLTCTIRFIYAFNS